jgi:hypothetical protein
LDEALADPFRQGGETALKLFLQQGALTFLTALMTALLQTLLQALFDTDAFNGGDVGLARGLVGAMAESASSSL